MDNIKTCPFCGNQPVMSTTPSGFFYIECVNDHCKVRPSIWAYQTKDEAISAWNERAT